MKCQCVYRQSCVPIVIVCMLLVVHGQYAAAEQWTLATDDTQLTIRLDSQGNAAIYELKNPTQQFNWIQQPNPIPLPSSVVRNGSNVGTNWHLQDTIVNKSDGTKLALRYVDTATGLLLTSEWWARPGAGPIHQASFITNNSSSPVTIPYQPTLALQLTAPTATPIDAWHFSSDGGAPDPQGVYRQTITNNFSGTVHTNPMGDSIPLAVLDSASQQGLYVGTEWSYGDIKITGSESNPQSVTVQSGNVQNFQTTLSAGQVFTVPPGFVGTYNGNIDAAGNSLRKYLYNYNMPAVLRNDPTYPKVQWNAWAATGKTTGSWDTVESKYYPLVRQIAPLGIEEVMLDIGWWTGTEPNADPVDWPSGMKAAADYAHQHGMRFGLYWNDGADMSTPEGRQARATRIKKLYEYGADLYRSDSNAGPLIASDYWSVKGFYDMIDGLQQEIPNFQWENCAGGGRIKDYGAMKRSVKIFGSDKYSPLDVRKVFYDSSFTMHPMQLEGHLTTNFNGLVHPTGAAGMKYFFRSSSMGAFMWSLDAPNGGNGDIPWTDEEKQTVAQSVLTYKTKIRPLVRSADLYHIFPRPDGTAWDGMEYYDPETYKGVVYIFKPDSLEDMHRIVLQGLDADKMYHLTFEDGSNPALRMSGADLMNVGVDVTLRGTNVSELMFIEVPEPGSLVSFSMAALFFGILVCCRRGGIAVPTLHTRSLHMQRTASIVRLLFVAVLLAAGGCSQKGTNQGAVSGTVKLDGKLLEQGSILFTPIEGANGMVSGGLIKDGQYQLSNAAAVAVGWNRVEIRAMRKTGKMVPKPFAKPGEVVEEQTEAIPPRFNSNSTLKVEIKSGDNTADFDVASR